MVLLFFFSLATYGTRIAINENFLQCRQGVCGKLSYLLGRKTTNSPVGATLCLYIFSIFLEGDVLHFSGVCVVFFVAKLPGEAVLFLVAQYGDYNYHYAHYGYHYG